MSAFPEIFKELTSNKCLCLLHKKMLCLLLYIVKRVKILSEGSVTPNFTLFLVEILCRNKITSARGPSGNEGIGSELHSSSHQS